MEKFTYNKRLVWRLPEHWIGKCDNCGNGNNHKYPHLGTKKCKYLIWPDQMEGEFPHEILPETEFDVEYMKAKGW